LTPESGRRLSHLQTYPGCGKWQVVIALLERRKATVKRFFLDKKSVRLVPANDAFEPIFATDCQIEAIVIGLVRRL
jgi:SOS-response transcriptional repressor LexA